MAAAVTGSEASSSSSSSSTLEDAITAAIGGVHSGADVDVIHLMPIMQCVFQKLIWNMFFRILVGEVL